MNDDELIAGLTEEERLRNGVPDAAAMRRRERAADAAASVFAGALFPNGIRTSPLGPGWSSDVDVHLSSDADPDRLASLGWVPMDAVLTALGHPGDGRWAIIEQGEVLGMADLHRTPPPDPVAHVLERCRRRGEVRLREALELRALARAGAVMPSKHPVLSIGARIEAAHGGSELRRWRHGRPARAPVRLPGARARRLAKRVVRRRPPKAAVALNGVDGSGKSTLARSLARDLERLGLPTTVVWTRPGMRIAWLDRLARGAKRLMREDPEPGVLRVAADPDRELRSRRGALGWVWAMLVTRSFIGDVRRRSRTGGAVTIYDRHALDALVTLSFAYRGVDLRAHRALVRSRMPAATIGFYLDVEAPVAAARKPGDAIGEVAVRRQLESYRSEIATMPGLVALDASRAPDEVAGEVLAAVLRLEASPAARAGAPAAPRQR